ncbi:MAG: hypothetical protein KJ645_10090 [Planctomycetes bacterium]|nr:hypothetical protein [Planctomycetota bacterium]
MNHDKIDADRFADLLLDAIHRFPDRSLLHIEAIGAIGRAIPVLSDLVVQTDHDRIRMDAVQCVVLNCDRETGFFKERWHSEDDLMTRAAAGISPAMFSLKDPELDHWLEESIEAESNSLVRNKLKDFRTYLESEEGIAQLRGEANKTIKITELAIHFIEERAAKNPLALQISYSKKMLELLDAQD